jgi:hypothetical protein
MVDPVTTNKALAQPPNAADPGTWDQPMNNNAGALDAVLGGLTTINAQGASGVIALTLAQYRPANVVVTGVPAGNLTYNLPAGVGGFYFFQNNTTGPATVSLGSASGGAAVAVPQGDCAVIVVDPVYGARRGDSIDTEAAGGPGQVQYADPVSGNFAGAAGLTYNSTTQAVAVGGPLSVGGALAVTGFATRRLIFNPGSASTRPIAIAFSATGMSIDCSQSNVFSTVLNGSITGAPAFANMDDGQTVNWRLQQDSVGNRTMAWPSNFRWPGGTVPTLSTPANAVDLLVCTFFASSGAWLANLLKNFA